MVSPPHEAANVLHTDGTERTINLYQAARPEEGEDTLLMLLIRPRDRSATLILDVTPEHGNPRELTWAQYNALCPAP